MNTTKKFYIISIDPGSGYTSFDDIVEKAMDDPKFAKMYPVITNQNLLDQLIQFIESPPKKIKGIGIANGEVFKKENGRQVSGSHRYLGVLEEDGTYNLYKRFKGGPLDGETWLILRVRDESYCVTKFILEFAKTKGEMSRIRDVENHFSNEKILVSRDRIQIILNHCHDAVSVVSKKTNVDYDVTQLLSVIPQQENQDPPSNNTLNTIVTQKTKQSQSSTVIVSLDNTSGKGSSKRLTKPIISNAIPLEPVITPVASESQQHPHIVKQGTPLVDRLRKPKTTASSKINMEGNPTSASSDKSGRTGSSMTSRKRRRV